MKRTYKIICILIISIVVFSLTCKVNAIDFWDKAQDFIDVGMEGKNETYLSTTTTMEETAKNKFEQVIDFLWSIGLLMIFISTVILGIKYMLVSPNEKSNIKQATTPYIVGVVIIFGALTIWKFVIDVLNGSL